MRLASLALAPATVLCAATFGALCLAAHAEAPGAPALHWSRAREAGTCIAPSVLAERVEQLTGPVLRRPAGAERVIEGHVEALPAGGYRARVTLSVGTKPPVGERVIEEPGADCRALDESIVLVVALMIDPSLSLDVLPPALASLYASEQPAEQRLLAELEASPPAAAASPRVVPPELPASTDAAPVVQPRARRVYEGSLMALAAFGVAPEALVGGSVQLSGALSEHWSVLGALRAAASLGLIPVGAEPAGSVAAQAFDAALAVCAGTESAPILRLRACLGPEYSLWRQEGHGFAHNESALLSGFGLTLALELRVRLRGALGVSVVGGGRLNMLSRRFVYDGEVTGYAVPRASLLVSAGPSYVF